MTSSVSTQSPANSPAPIRLGYVGCGFMAQHVHLPNFCTLPECTLLAIAEKRTTLAKTVAQRLGVPEVYSNHLELAADPEIEAAAVSANYAQQGEIAADLLRAGKNVFMEKPLAVSVAQSERILSAAREGRTRLMVGYMKRFDPGNLVARSTISEWLRDGSKGRLLFVRNHGFGGNWLNGLDRDTSFTSTNEAVDPFPLEGLLPEWLPGDAAKSYIGYLQQYCHNLNLLRFLLGTESRDDLKVESVSLDPDGMTGIVALKLGPFRCVLETASSQFHSWDEHTQIYFEGGWIRVQAPRFFAKSEFSQVEIYEAGSNPRYSYPIVNSIYGWNYRAEAAHFLQALQTGEPFVASGEDAQLDILLVEKIYQHHLRVR